MNWMIALPNLDSCPSGERDFFSSLFIDIAAYCSLKNKTEESREAGDWEAVEIHEQAAEELYNKLPDNVKWRGEVNE